jgi:hypothetical protein
MATTAWLLSTPLPLLSGHHHERSFPLSHFRSTYSLSYSFCSSSALTSSSAPRPRALDGLLQQQLQLESLAVQTLLGHLLVAVLALAFTVKRTSYVGASRVILMHIQNINRQTWCIAFYVGQCDGREGEVVVVVVVGGGVVPISS